MVVESNISDAGLCHSRSVRRRLSHGSLPPPAPAGPHSQEQAAAPASAGPQGTLTVNLTHSSGGSALTCDDTDVDHCESAARGQPPLQQHPLLPLGCVGGAAEAAAAAAAASPPPAPACARAVRAAAVLTSMGAAGGMAAAAAALEVASLKPGAAVGLVGWAAAAPLPTRANSPGARDGAVRGGSLRQLSSSSKMESGDQQCPQRRQHSASGGVAKTGLSEGPAGCGALQRRAPAAAGDPLPGASPPGAAEQGLPPASRWRKRYREEQEQQQKQQEQQQQVHGGGVVKEAAQRGQAHIAEVQPDAPSRTAPCVAAAHLGPADLTHRRLPGVPNNPRRLASSTSSSSGQGCPPAHPPPARNPTCVTTPPHPSSYPVPGSLSCWPYATPARPLLYAPGTTPATTGTTTPATANRYLPASSSRWAPSSAPLAHISTLTTQHSPSTAAATPASARNPATSAAAQPPSQPALPYTYGSVCDPPPGACACPGCLAYRASLSSSSPTATAAAAPAAAAASVLGRYPYTAPYLYPYSTPYTASYSNPYGASYGHAGLGIPGGRAPSHSAPSGLVRHGVSVAPLPVPLPTALRAVSEPSYPTTLPPTHYSGRVGGIGAGVSAGAGGGAARQLWYASPEQPTKQGERQGQGQGQGCPVPAPATKQGQGQGCPVPAPAAAGVRGPAPSQQEEARADASATVRSLAYA